jgi:O-antigen/teichoic acid export membrane protein
LAGQLVRGGIGSLIVKISNVFLGMALAVVLARALGPDGYGVYAYVFATVSILAIPAQFGIPRLVVRETARAQVHERWGLMRGMWRWATLVVVCLCGLLVVFSALGIWLFRDRFSDLQQATFFFGLLLTPLIALGNLRGAALQGLRRVVLGQLPEHILRPGLLALLVLAAIGMSASGVTAAQAMGLHVAAAGIAFMVGAWFLYRSRPDPLRLAPEPVYEPRTWFMATWPLALTAGMQQINKNTSIIMLGFFLAADDVGIYRVAVQGAMLVVFGQQAVAMFVSPYYARLHAKGDMVQLQRLVTVSARLAFFTALPLVLVFLLWGDAVIGLLFGIDYTRAAMPLTILAIGQLINAMFGHVGLLLNMTGHERDTTRGMAIAAGFNVILNLVLIPWWGINGAALAMALTLVIWNLFLWRSVHRRLSLKSAAFF